MYSTRTLVEALLINYYTIPETAYYYHNFGRRPLNVIDHASGFMGLPLLIFHAKKTVACSPHGLYVQGLCRIDFYFFPQTVDMYRNGFNFTVHILSPDFIVLLFLAEHHIFMRGEKVQQFIFFVDEGNFFFIHRNTAGFVIYFEPAEINFV